MMPPAFVTVIIIGLAIFCANSRAINLLGIPKVLSLALPQLAASAALSVALTTSPLLGNVESALKAIIDDRNAITCTLDTQQIDEFHGSCQQLKKVVRWRAGTLLTIKQDWGGSSSTGGSIWNSANLEGQFMENGLGRERLQGKSVLELGAGVGFSGLIADALGASDVTVTDGNEDVLRLADENIRVNLGANQASVRTARLRWNTDDEAAFAQREKPWDYIFAADVTYLKANRANLIASIYHLSGPSTVTYLSMEPRIAGEVEDVLALAEKQGLSWREEMMPVDPLKEGCSLLCERMFSFKKIPNTL